MLVTHHVEEIPPGFTHAMLLPTAAGWSPRDRSPRPSPPSTLADTFDLELSLTEAGGRWAARAL